MLVAGCYKITTVFSHAQTVVLCVGCSTVLCQPTGGKARLTEGMTLGHLSGVIDTASLSHRFLLSCIPFVLQSDMEISVLTTVQTGDWKLLLYFL